MLDYERAHEIKLRLPWTVFEILKFRKYLHSKSFAWKSDCPISSKLQLSRF